jgi:tetratricopeptide (TPR) repeat protein
MILLGSFTRTALAILCAVTLCGCFPSGQSQQDEEKEPHFLAGRARVNSMDFDGAIESFEKALEVNPRSASAHFELGWLFAEKESDPAAAIYHYEQYLKLRPTADNMEIIKQHIFRLKQDLAKAILPLPTTPGLQREFEQLADDNRRLRDEVEKWRAYYASRGAAPTNLPAAPSMPMRTVPVASPVQAPSPIASQQKLTDAGRAAAGTTSAARTHKVQSGENPAAIARKYGVKLDALMAANPGLDPKRLRVGQTLNIPSP